MNKVKIIGDKAQIYTPYNQYFVLAMRSMDGAKWNREGGFWEVPTQILPSVRKVMESVYGESDISNTPHKNVKLFFQKRVDCIRGPVTIMGKVICRANGRDSGGTIGEDVCFLKGRPYSGGSKFNWMSIVPEGAIVTLYNVPVTLLSTPLPDGCTMEIEDQQIDRNSLLAERERLLLRIQEIDALLES